jgi:uncharacterized protein
MQDKFKRLQEILLQKQRLAIAFSGGVDSSFLLWAANRVLGDNAVAITVIGDMIAPEEQGDSVSFATQFKIKQYTIPVDVFQLAGFCENSPERCYYCKQFLFGKIKELAATMNMEVAEGSNVDDLGDYRPGRKALAELQISSPLLEAGLTKAEIRQISHLYGLPTWEKPSFACLASRIPYGTTITPENLSQVAKAETYLHQMGLRQLRVRHHGDIARIETDEAGMELLLSHRSAVDSFLKTLGFSYVTLDLESYRTGRLNDILAKNS